MERSILLYDKCMPFGFAIWICLALALRQMEAKPVKIRLHFFHSASWRTKKWTIHSFLVIFSCCFFLLLQFVIRVYHSLVYVEEYIGIGIYISLVKMKLCWGGACPCFAWALAFSLP